MAVQAREIENTPRADTVARGAVCLMAGQFSLLVAGYLMHAYVGRTLGPSPYGLFGVVMALLVWFEVSLTGAFPYAIRKLGAEDQAMIPQIARTALLGQFIYASAIFAVVEVSAPWFALALGDPSLAPLIRIASLDIPVYAAYFCYLGVLNGSGAFSRQSIAIVVYSGSKFAATAALVAAGAGVRGALIGNAAASVAGLAAARLLAGPIRSKERYPVKKVLGFVAGTALLAILFTFLINLDIFLVKALVKDRVMVGAYAAAATLAKAPFFLFLAIASVTLPSVSRASASEDRNLVRIYIGQSFRLHLMLLMPLTAVVSAASSGIVSLIYRSGFDAASAALSILIAAFMFWGLLNGIYNILLARRQTRYPVIATVVMIIVMAVLARLLVPVLGIAGAAAAAALVSLGGLSAAVLYAYRQFDILIPAWSLVRISAASTAAFMLTWAAGANGITVIGAVAGGLAVCVLTLVASGEITRQDISKLAAAVRS